MTSNTNKEEKKDLGCEYHEICEKCGYPEIKKKKKKKSAPQPKKQDVPSPNPLEEEWEKNLIEKMADMEHMRWAKWQNYLHSFLTWNNEIQAWVLPHEKKDHWQMQINTPYQMLSEKEKESDRDQVKPYLPLIQTQKHLSYNQGVADGKREVVEKIDGAKIIKEERLPYENSPEIYGNQRLEAYKKGYNQALQDIKDTLSNQIGNNK